MLRPYMHDGGLNFRYQAISLFLNICTFEKKNQIVSTLHAFVEKIYQHQYIIKIV